MQRGIKPMIFNFSVDYLSSADDDFSGVGRSQHDVSWQLNLRLQRGARKQQNERRADVPEEAGHGDAAAKNALDPERKVLGDRNKTIFQLLFPMVP